MRFDLLVHPEMQGRLENPLINYALRQASQQYRGALTEHPADDLYAEQVFRHYEFAPERSLIHMRWQYS
jgi:hypothetical protein